MEILSRDLVDTITRRLVEEFNPESIYLFGSHVWGEPTIDSDIDLMVIISDSSQTVFERATRARRCLRDLMISKDVLVKTRREFDRYSDLEWSLEGQILSRGKLLYERPQN